MTHDCQRHDSATPFAALNARDGTVLGRCMPQHRRQEFVRFVDINERAFSATKLMRAAADNCANRKHAEARAWLERRSRWVFRFTPTSASWLNAVLRLPDGSVHEMARWMNSSGKRCRRWASGRRSGSPVLLASGPAAKLGDRDTARWSG
jgi:hypothetical protein